MSILSKYYVHNADGPYAATASELQKRPVSQKKGVTVYIIMTHFIKEKSEVPEGRVTRDQYV